MTEEATAQGPAPRRGGDAPREPYPALEGAFAIEGIRSRKDRGSELAVGPRELEPGQSTVWRSFIENDTAPGVRTAAIPSETETL